MIRNTNIKGLTLIEIMVVVVIIGLLAAVIAPRVVDYLRQAEVTKAQADIRQLESSLKMFRTDNGFYPDTEQGLEALVSKPSSGREPRNYKPNGYIERLPKDPWGQEYLYLRPGSHGFGEYDLYSKGPDPDISEDDIGNWNLE